MESLAEVLSSFKFSDIDKFGSRAPPFVSLKSISVSLMKGARGTKNGGDLHPSIGL